MPGPLDRVASPGFTLANAIRKGAAQHLQCMGVFFHCHPLDGITASCVLGAALVGVFGGDTTVTDLPALLVLYPELTAHRFPTCPTGDACPRFLSGPYTGDPNSKPLHAVLAHLNDVHRWTREHCADWLETYYD